MPRPKKCRRIAGIPKTTFFKPRGVPLCHLEEIYLTLDGFEALRLTDYEKCSLEEGAKQMGVSRHTFGRLLNQARQNVARALVEGSALCILYEDDAQHLHITPQQTTTQEKKMTVIAISSEGPKMTDHVDPRFGRAGGFVLVTLETMATTYLENGAAQAMAHGAGIHTAEQLVNAGVSVVLSGRLGPKAQNVLQAAHIKIVEDMDGKTVEEALKTYQASIA